MIKYKELEQLLDKNIKTDWKVLEIGSNGIPGYLDHRHDLEIMRTNIIPLPGVEKIVDAQHLPFKSNSFDAVFMVATDYYVQNIEDMFSEISRILRKNGLLINASYKYSNLTWQVKNQPTAIHALKPSEYVNIYNKKGMQTEFQIILNNEPKKILKKCVWKLTPSFILRARSQWLIHLCTKI